jgi:hypothetical protein
MRAGWYATGRVTREIALLLRRDLALGLPQIEEKLLLVGGRAQLHQRPRTQDNTKRAWHDRLCSYYRELGIEREQRRQRVDLAPFGDAMCEVVEDTRPEVVSFTAR